MNPYRLPRHVVPRRYELRLEPHLTYHTFQGEARISLDVLQQTHEIVFNAAELAIDRAEILGGPYPLSGIVVLDEATERAQVTFASPIPPGETTLRLVFRGHLNDKLRGFYRSNYRDATGVLNILAATQFEATDARRAFPCWDEPDFKAVFSITLIIDPTYKAISNTSIVSESLVESKTHILFADSVPMSTYLVAFIVGALEGTSPVLAGEISLRAWCIPGKTALTSVALDIGAFSLNLFEDYYGQPYPGEKLDLIAIPDFAAGAMENLGAITFRETTLLVDPTAATHAEIERVADVVAHEVAHMWFGDLVTMAWWNGLWLNEAFATFLEMVAVDAWRPQWRRWTTFGVSRAAAFLVDGLHNTRPIEYPVQAPRDADAMFDVLTYEKGASVLRMMEQYLGPEVFRAGVRLYLERHKFANAETGDLWAALSTASNQPIPEILDSWVFHPGYPLVSVKRQGDMLVLQQERFTYLPSPPEGGPKSSPPFWHIPIHIRTHGESTQTQRMVLSTRETQLALPYNTHTVVVNEGGHGFYRVQYDEDLQAALLERLDNTLSPIERFNMANDAWALALAGRMSVEDFLLLTAYFRSERDRNVWSVFLSAFQMLNRIVDEAERPALVALIRDRLAPTWGDLGWDARPGDEVLTRQLRGDLIRILGTLGEDKTLQNEARIRFDACEDDPTGLDPDVWSAILLVSAHTGDASRYQGYLRRLMNARTPQEEQRYLYGLVAFRAPDLVARTLARTLSGEVRSQDAPYVLRTCLMSVHGRSAAWAFIQENWDEMARTFPAAGLRRMCEGFTGLTRRDWETQVQAFIRRNAIDLGGKTLAQYLEQLRMSVAMKERGLGIPEISR